MIRAFLAVCVLLAAALVSVYGFAAGEDRADLVYVNPSDIHTLDPARMSWTQDFRVGLNLWEGLTTWHSQTLEPVAGVAILPPEISADRRTYVFHLRPDARWSDGGSVTAADFVRGWRRAIEPGSSADYAFLIIDHIAGAAEYVSWRMEMVALLAALRLRSDGGALDDRQAALMERVGATDLAPYDVALLRQRLFEEHARDSEARFEKVGVLAKDDTTLVVKLSRPCPYLLDLLALPVFLPIHAGIERLRERTGDTQMTPEGLVVFDPQWTKPDYHRGGYEGIVTNGAFRLADWTFKRRARFTVNPFHPEARAIACRTVDMLVLGNINASILAYETGDVDFLTTLDVPYDHELVRLSASGERPDLHAATVLATHFLNFNCRDEFVAGRPNPFRDPAVRNAFTLSIDRRRIVENVLQRGDQPADSFVPRGLLSTYDPPIGLPYDVERARQLMADAGYGPASPLPIVELLYSPNDERVCQAVARMWEETLGVNVELRSQETKTFADRKAAHQFMIAPGDWYADYNDPTTFLNCLTSGNGNNDSGFSNKLYDELLSAANEAAIPADRVRFLQEAEAVVIAQECPIIPILHYNKLLAWRSNVTGLHPNARLWFPFRHVSVRP